MGIQKPANWMKDTQGGHTGGAHRGEDCPVHSQSGATYRVWLIHGLVALAKALRINRTLSVVNVLNNRIDLSDIDDRVSQITAVFMESSSLTSICGFKESQTEADFAGCGLDQADARLLEVELSCSSRFTSINLIRNEFGVAAAEGLVKIKASNPDLKTLCGAIGPYGNEVELDLNTSSTEFAAADAVLYASDLQSNPAFSALCKVTFSGGGATSMPVTMGVNMTRADFSRKALGAAGARILQAFLPRCR